MKRYGISTVIIITFLVISQCSSASEIVTIPEAHYAFNVMQPTVNIEVRIERPTLSKFDQCVQDNVRNGYDEIDSENWCEKVLDKESDNE